jgi:two-component system cell cycle sensor histidine kinase/response regulator CckA
MFRSLLRWGLVPLVFSGLPTAAPAAPQPAPAPRQIVVGIERDSPPYELLDEHGHPVGFDVDLVREVAAASGLELRFVSGSREELRRALAAGSIQLLAGALYEDDRLQTERDVLPHTKVEYAIFARQGGFAARSLRDLAGREVIVQRAGNVEESLRSKSIPFKLIPVDSMSEGLSLLASGRHDCALASRHQGLLLIGTLGISNLIIVGPPVFYRSLCFELQSGDEELLARLRRGLANVRASGAYNRLYRKWFELLEPSRITRVWLFRHAGLLLLPLLALLLVVVAWSWTLSKRVEQRTRALRDELAERQRVEEALRESEGRFRALADTAPFGIVIVQGAEIVYANRAAEEIHGYGPHELLGASPWQLIHPEHRALVVERAERRLSGGVKGPEREEIKILTKGGAERRVECSLVTIALEGKPAIVVAVTDITDRRKSQDIQSAIFEISEAARSAGTLDELFASLHTVVGRLMAAENFYIALYDPETDLLSFPYFVDQLDERPAPFKPGRGMTGYVLRTGKPLLATAEAIAELENAGEVESLGAPSVDWLGVPLKVRDRTIGVLAVQSYSGTVRYGEMDREILSYVSIQAAQAIERTLADKELRESEERYRLALQATQEIMYDWDITRNRLVWNPNVQKVLGYTVEEMGTGLETWVSLLHPEDSARVQAELSAAVERDEVFHCEYRFRKKAGDYAALLDRGLIIRDAGGKPARMVGAMIDLSERKRLEDQLRDVQKLEAVGRLAGGIAHDFNNLLTALLGSTELLQRRLGEEHHALPELATIHRTARRAADFTQGLLAFARRQVLEPVDLDLNGFLSEALPMLRRMIPENIRIDFRAGIGLDTVRADRGQLTQILMNLCVNARDAMPDGGAITISTENMTMAAEFIATHRGARRGRYVSLAVTDTGSGISPDDLARVFEPFFTTKERGKGTGLGLSTVYGIVKQHGGFIYTQSRPGSGSTFTVYLPVVPAQGEPREAPAETATRGGPETILVVEDEVEVRHVLVEALTGLGYSVRQAADGVDALSELRKDQAGVDLVLTDVVMPRMGGMELCTAAREIYPNLRFLFSSGYTEDTVHDGFVKKEGVFFLAKPYGIDLLARKVREVLDCEPSAGPSGDN